jgi:gamma-glutamylputrescine oxidase
MLREPQGRAGAPIWREALPPGRAGGDWPREADLAVVGGGFTGLSAAYHALLARPGARVVVLEAEGVGHGASSRNTGMLTPGVGQDAAALVRRWGAAAAREMYRRSLEAVEYVGELAAREAIDAELRMGGQLIVACGRSGRRRLARQAGALEALDLPCERLDDRGLAGRLSLGVQAQGGDAAGPAALRLPVAGTLHPGKLLRGLAEAVRRRGGTVVEGAAVTALSRRGPTRLTLAGGRQLAARHVVVATSGYSSPVNLQRGRLIPLHLRVLLSEPLSPRQVEGLGWHGREGVIDSRRLFSYFRLTEDGRVLFGGGRPRYLWGGKLTDQAAEGPDLGRLVHEFRRFFPSLGGVGVARSWTGVIAYSLDALPVIARAPEYDGVLFVGGWCGHGIALSISSGRWVQELIASGGPGQALPWFRAGAPRTPPDPLRWLGVRAAGWAMELLDRI